MPRSAVDATRFTPTGPHASSKSSPTAATAKAPLPSSAATPRETPQQKVARLREAARRAKLERISTFDKVVLVGRVWADKAHRFTAYSLMTFSVVSALYAGVALGDMVLYNRRKKKEWVAAETAVYNKYLELAIAAEAQGNANEDQIQFLEKERMIVRMEEEQANKWRIWKRTKAWLLKDLKQEDGDMGAAVAAQDATAGSTGGVLEAVEARRKELADEHKVETPQGGILDQLAAGEKLGAAATAPSSDATTSSSWFGGWGKGENRSQ